MQFTMQVDLRHVEVVRALLHRAAAENQRKLNERLDRVTADQLGLRASASPDSETRNAIN